jgi:hypothetical protein
VVSKPGEGTAMDSESPDRLGTGQDYEGASPAGSSKHCELSPRKQECWGKTWVVNHKDKALLGTGVKGIAPWVDKPLGESPCHPQAWLMKHDVEEAHVFPTQCPRG